MTTPKILWIVQQGKPLNGLMATAAKLWLFHNKDEYDPDGKLAARVEDYWRSRPGSDPYWNYLRERGRCDKCASGNKMENLSICPNCFRTYCYRHKKTCDCGHKPVG